MEDSASFSGNRVVSPAWNNLPVELWLEIFKHLSQPHLLFVVRHVCHYFNTLIFDPCLWKSFDLNEWKENASLKQLSLTSEETNHVPVFDNCDIDLLTMLLLVDSHVTSTDAFVPIIKHIHSFVKSISISTYGGDFELGELQQNSLHNCRNLTCLNLSYCDDISPPVLNRICQNCSKIDTLIFEGCGNLSDEVMEEIGKFQHLEKLDISHCSSVTDDGLFYITDMPCQLKHFLSNGVLHLSDKGITQLVCRQNKIEKLVLDGENLTDISIKMAIRNLKHLITFKISFCNTFSDRSIMALTETTSLKWLHLRKLAERISAPVITQLFAQDSMCHLVHLALTDSQSVTDLTVIAVSTVCPKLQYVQFDWCNQVTDDGIDKLVKACRYLRQMFLVGLKYLSGLWLRSLDTYLPHLTLLDLSMCDDIGDEDLFQLVKRKPDLVAYSYFHEQVDTTSLEDLIDFRYLVASPNSQISIENQPACPGSKGARVDF